MAIKKEIEIELKSTLDDKGITDAKQQVDTLNQSTRQLGNSSQQSTQSVKKMGQGALQAAKCFNSLQGGIRGVMNNIPMLVASLGGGAGLVGAISIAVSAGKLLYDLFSDINRESDELAEKMEKRSQEIAESSRQAMRESYQVMQNFNSEERTKTVNEEYQNYVKGITREFENQTEELEKQIRLRKDEAARQKGVDTKQAELDRVNLENDYQEGRITKRQRDLGLMMVDQNMSQKTRQLDLSVEQSNYLNMGKQLEEVSKARDAAGTHAFDMQSKYENLPSIQNILGLLQKQKTLNQSIDNLTKKIYSHEGDLEDFQRQLDALASARVERQSVESKLNKFQDSLRTGGVNLEFDYKQGTDVNSRFKQAVDAVEEFKKNTDAAKKQFDELTEKAGSLGDAMASTEASIKNMEQIDAIQSKIDSAKVKNFDLQRDRDEAEEAKKNEERKQKAREDATSDAKKKTAERQQTMIRGISLEGVPEAPSGRQQQRISAAREALDAGKKKLSESISTTDNEIDPGEISGAFDAMAKVLIDRGQYTKSLMEHLQSIISTQTSKINAAEAGMQQYVDAKLAEMQREVQQSTGRLSKAVNRLSGSH